MSDQTVTGQPPARSRPTTFPAPSPRRPSGHVIGHGLDEPPPPPLDGRPRGHVVGHAH